MNPYLEVSPRNKYLARLSERLDNLGYDVSVGQLSTIGLPLLKALKRELGIPYCERCKLPCAPEDMDPIIPNTCKEHAP